MDVDDVSRFYFDHRRDLLDYAFFLARSAADADDAVAHAVLKSYEYYLEHGTPAPPGSDPVSWMKAIVRNHVFDQERRGKAAERQPPGTAVSSTGGEVEDVLDGIIAKQAWQAVRSLPARSREIAMLRWRDGLTPGEIAERLQISPASVRIQLSRVRRRLRSELDFSDAPEVTIYLSDGSAHDRVETEVERFLESSGAQIERRGDPLEGSWFRRIRVRAGAAANSPAARELEAVALHAADARLVHTQDAFNTATMMQNLGPVIASLQPTKDAVLRIGALLIVKVDWKIVVHQLTPAQQLQLDHDPQLAMSPDRIMMALRLDSGDLVDLTPGTAGDDEPAVSRDGRTDGVPRSRSGNR